jgi:sugar phosphate isomerase/epimerase
MRRRCWRKPAPPAEQAARIAEAAKKVGLPPTTLAPFLRSAALDFRTDDAAARIAASTLAADLCALLARDPA